jgi:peptidoglycan-N-acetylglucosamine deacetylase
VTLWVPTLVTGVAAAAAGISAYGTFSPNAGVFGRAIGRGSASEMLLYLTFDDGPNPRGTEEILDVLEREGVPATFFQVGRHVALYPRIARRVAESGHEIGNHTLQHAKLHARGPRFIRRELLGAHEAILAATGFAPRSFRAPHGLRNPFVNPVAYRLRYDVFGWTFGVWDSDRPGAEEIRRRVRARLCPGAIILLHDGDGYDPAGDRSQTAGALTGIIRDARDAGYEFRPLRDLASQPDAWSRP